MDSRNRTPTRLQWRKPDRRVVRHVPHRSLTEVDSI